MEEFPFFMAQERPKSLHQCVAKLIKKEEDSIQENGRNRISKICRDMSTVKVATGIILRIYLTSKI